MTVRISPLASWAIAAPRRSQPCSPKASNGRPRSRQVAPSSALRRRRGRPSLLSRRVPVRNASTIPPSASRAIRGSQACPTGSSSAACQTTLRRSIVIGIRPPPYTQGDAKPAFSTGIVRTRASPMTRIVAVRVLDPHPWNTLVEIEADDGTVGIGLTQSAPAHVRPIIEDGPSALRTHLIGRDPLDIAARWSAMWEGWPGQYGRGSEGGLAANAMGALDIALWDLAGKLQDKPVWELLGGKVQDRVMAYASGSMFVSSSYEGGGPGPWAQKSPERLRDEAAAEVAKGFRALKFGWGTHFEAEDRDRLHAIREGAGPETRIMVDVGCCPGYWTPGWDADAAIAAGRMLEAVDAFFMEEPMPPHDVDGHA